MKLNTATLNALLQIQNIKTSNTVWIITLSQADIQRSSILQDYKTRVTLKITIQKILSNHAWCTYSILDTLVDGSKLTMAINVHHGVHTVTSYNSVALVQICTMEKCRLYNSSIIIIIRQFKRCRNMSVTTRAPMCCLDHFRVCTTTYVNELCKKFRQIILNCKFQVIHAISS